MTGFYDLNGVLYCAEHRPASRLAQLNMRLVRPEQFTRADRCHVCGARPEVTA